MLSRRMLSAACVLMIATTSALQHHQAVVRAPLLRPAAAARHAAPEALLPKALAAVFLIPWGVQLSYAAEVSLGIENGPFSRFVKSDAVQQGPKMRRMKKGTKSKVRGVRLPAAAAAATRTFRKSYSSKELEPLWGAMLKCYGSEERALAAVQANPQVPPPPPPPPPTPPPTPAAALATAAVSASPLTAATAAATATLAGDQPFLQLPKHDDRVQVRLPLTPAAPAVSARQRPPAPRPHAEAWWRLVHRPGACCVRR